jgi:endogenous inhibitor of DNA gyrase (YacG/DUF329 family)
MIKVRCPICDKPMHGQSTAEWPELPFCSARCRTIDLGRWLGGSYRIPTEAESASPEHGSEDEDIP